MKREFLRYLVGGGINTAATYMMFLGLSTAVHHTIAYSISYVIGIGLAYLINSYLVFKTETSLKSAAAYPIIYVFQYFFGLVLLSILVQQADTRKDIAMLIVIAANVPLSFILTRKVLRA